MGPLISAPRSLNQRTLILKLMPRVATQGTLGFHGELLSNEIITSNQGTPTL